MYRYVNGTPSDCVHVALTGLLGHRPDLVLSGINNGANMGDDTLYSGTVAAAMEGYLFRHSVDRLLARSTRAGATSRRRGSVRRGLDRRARAIASRRAPRRGCST